MPRKSQVPEGRNIYNTHIDKGLHLKVRLAAMHRGVQLPEVTDEALRLWLRAQPRF
jgi:hypothetical protein